MSKTFVLYYPRDDAIPSPVDDAIPTPSDDSIPTSGEVFIFWKSSFPKKKQKKHHHGLNKERFKIKISNSLYMRLGRGLAVVSLLLGHWLFIFSRWRTAQTCDQRKSSLIFNVNYFIFHSPFTTDHSPHCFTFLTHTEGNYRFWYFKEIVSFLNLLIQQQMLICITKLFNSFAT